MHPGFEYVSDLPAGVGNIPLVYHIPEDGHDVKSVGSVQVVIGGENGAGFGGGPLGD